ncbi:MAG: L,D-transpeptidase family protein [Gallionella sp.]
MRKLLGILLLCLPLWASAASPSIDLVRVIKSERKLQLISEGKILHEFKVSLGGNPNGHKIQEGDERTPEGLYKLDYKKADSAFHKAFHISYPNAQDIAAAKSRDVNPGGNIMIHGQKNGLGWLSSISQRFDWTNGCIALTDSEIDVMWEQVKEGTAVEISP